MVARWALLALGDLSRNLPCAGGGFAAVFGGSCLAAGHGVRPIASYSLTRAVAHPINLRGARSRVHRVTSDNDSIV